MQKETGDAIITNLPKYIIFVGNPGTGKSTLLNGLINEAKFLSGISFGEGKTTILQLVTKSAITYGDTPGLSDIKMRKRAAEEITKILKQNGQYKIFFVCTLESGRVRPDDVTTIKLVLESITVPIEYGIIVNKITKQLQHRLQESEEGGKNIIACLNTEHRSTLFFYFYTKNDDLEDRDNVVPVHSKKFLEFIETVPYTVLESRRVADIQVEEYERLKAMFEEKLKEFAEENTKITVEMNRMIEENNKKKLVSQNFINVS